MDNRLRRNAGRQWASALGDALFRRTTRPRSRPCRRGIATAPRPRRLDARAIRRADRSRLPAAAAGRLLAKGWRDHWRQRQGAGPGNLGRRCATRAELADLLRQTAGGWNRNRRGPCGPVNPAAACRAAAKGNRCGPKRAAKNWLTPALAVGAIAIANASNRP